MKAKQDREVQAKQFWRRKSTGQQVRVLGVVEGYVVARVKGAGPFLYGWRDFEKDFDRLHIASAERPNMELRGAEQASPAERPSPTRGWAPQVGDAKCVTAAN